MHLYLAKRRQNVDSWPLILSIFGTNICKIVTNNSGFIRVTTFKFTDWELLLTFRITFLTLLSGVLFAKADIDR